MPFPVLGGLLLELLTAVILGRESGCLDKMAQSELTLQFCHLSDSDVLQLSRFLSRGHELLRHGSMN